MVNGNQEARQIQKENAPPSEATVTVKTPKELQIKPLLPKLAVIIALASLGASAYILKLNQDMQHRLSAQQNRFLLQVDELKTQRDQDKALFTTATHHLETAQTTLQQQLKDMNKQLSSAMNQRFYQNTNWLLLKARYYMELAQINAHWSNSFSASTELLQQADHLLQQSSEPLIFDIRQAIASDIAQIKALPQVDITGILSQLDAAQNSVSALQVLPEKRHTETSEPEHGVSASYTAPWKSHLQDSMNALSQLIVIRRNDENIQPLVSPLFAAAIKESIHLNLQEAQWAVLYHDESVYQLVLKQAITQIQQNFNTDATNTRALLKQLTELQHKKLRVAKPEVGTAIPLLNQLLDKNQPSAPGLTGEQPGGTS